MGRPSSITLRIREKSSILKAEKESIRYTTTWLCLACSIVLTWTFFRDSSSFRSKLGVLSPAVSISYIFRSLKIIFEIIESLVVWGTSETTSLSSPKSSLIREDFPTLGLPIKQILILFFIFKFFISVPRELLKLSSGLIKKSSTFYSSKSSFISGSGLIFLKSRSHCLILIPFVSKSSISYFIFLINSSNFFTLSTLTFSN